VLQPKIKKQLLFAGETGVDAETSLLDALPSGNQRQGIGLMGQHIKQIVAFGGDVACISANWPTPKPLRERPCSNLQHVPDALQRSRKWTSSFTYSDSCPQRHLSATGA
jgi:hypothetical protein